MKKDKKQSIIIAFILSHRKLVTILCVVMYILFTVLLCQFTPLEDNEKRFSLDRIGSSAEIISFFFIVVSSIIAVWQYYISCRNEHIKNNTEKIQKSIDLIEYYKNNILDKLTVIKFIFRNSGISEVLNCIDKSKIENFDAHELEQLLTKDKIDKLKEIETGQNFVNVVLIANESFNLKLPGILYGFDEQSRNEIQIKVNPQKVMNAFLANFISDTLNNLEYFSMHFAHNIANEGVIYQSAHQTFLEMVELLYYNISKVNTPDNSKYYTNIIDLYNTWKCRQAKFKREIIAGQRCAVSKGANAANIEI